MKVKSHDLKIEKQFFDELFCSQNKRVEIRLNDRDYQRGDLIRFETSFGNSYAQITHVLSGWGITDNHVALSIKIITERCWRQLLNFK